MRVLYLLLLLPFLANSQTFHFNEDGSANPVSYSTIKSAKETYSSILQWLDKSSAGKSKPIDSKENEFVVINGSFWNAFEKQALYGSTPKYKAYYKILIQVKDNSYTIRYSHIEFKDQTKKPVSFDLNAVLGGYCSYLGPDALKNYEFHINQLFESINYFVENGRQIKRSAPLRGYPEVFKFNADGSSAPVVCKINKDSEEIYHGIESWSERNIAFPKKSMNASTADRTITIEFEDWNIFEKEFDNADLSKKRYSARYTLQFKVIDDEYKVNFMHNEFLSDAETVDVTLPEITSGKSSNPDFEGGKEGYEYKINKVLYSINEYLKALK